jgi:predicted porin
MKTPMIAAATLLTLSGMTHAQTSVSIYGIVDAGLVRESGGPDGNVTALGGGVASGSRLGFRGKEDLGGGLSANFLLENGFNSDNGTLGQGGLLFGRQMYVGLSGDFGAVRMGRQYSPYYLALRDVADPFAAGLAGRAGNIMATNTRVNNMINYVTPKFGGFFADIAYGLGEVAGDAQKNRTIGAAIGYEQGPAAIKLAHHQLNNATATDRTKNTLLAARYKFRLAEGSIGYAINKGLGAADSRDFILGVSVPFGSNRLLGSYIRHDDRTATNRDAHQWAIGYFYGLSKRTDLYVAYARISNDNGADFKVGNATDTGTGNKAFNLGVRHTF